MVWGWVGRVCVEGGGVWVGYVIFWVVCGRCEGLGWGGEVVWGVWEVLGVGFL